MKHYLIVVITLLMPQIAVSANLVQNGSFEDPIQDPGTFSVQTSIPGWDLVSGSGIEIRNNLDGLASDGFNFVELDSDSNSAMQQSIVTSAGNLYELVFDFSPRIFQPASTNGIEVFWNDLLLISLTGEGGAENIWESHKFFVTGSGSDRLRFAAVGIDDSLGGNIDNVRLESEVPIPAAFWLLASALGMLSFIPKLKSVSIASL